jgi:hypothetical protein
LRQAESRIRVNEICREHTDQRRHVLRLEEEIIRAWFKRVVRAAAAARGERKLKRLVAELSVDRHILPGDRAKKL